VSAVLVACIVAALPATAAVAAPAAEPRGQSASAPEFDGGVERLSPALRERMEGSSWHEGCPVGLGSLRLVRAAHWDFRGRPVRGVLVVHERYAADVLDVLARLYAKRFPIRRMELVDRYGADDHRSMAHDNTSAFNCRFVNGTDRWSMHAYGKAIDINPRENPYVSGDLVSPPEGRPYADRRPRREGMIFRHGPVVGAFARIAGWEWAGAPSPTRSFRDYQHLSSNGS
jgi:poly-gamma-glutamate synthesis protein (capsule biosynthesis protein)